MNAHDVRHELVNALLRKAKEPSNVAVKTILYTVANRINMDTSLPIERLFDVVLGILIDPSS